MVTAKGETNYLPKSISYDNLPDNNDFERVYNDALTFIANRLSMTNEDLSIEILTHF